MQSAFSRRTALAGLAMTWSAGAALAYDESIKRKCESDYFAYCSQYAHGSPNLRYCFESHRNSLSRRCIEALYDAGEIPRKYLNKREH